MHGERRRAARKAIALESYRIGQTADAPTAKRFVTRETARHVLDASPARAPQGGRV